MSWICILLNLFLFIFLNSFFFWVKLKDVRQDYKLQNYRQELLNPYSQFICLIIMHAQLH